MQAPCQGRHHASTLIFQPIAIEDALLACEMRQDCACRTIARSKFEQAKLSP